MTACREFISVLLVFGLLLSWGPVRAGCDGEDESCCGTPAPLVVADCEAAHRGCGGERGEGPAECPGDGCERSCEGCICLFVKSVKQASGEGEAFVEDGFFAGASFDALALRGRSLRPSPPPPKAVVVI
ncbi:MAG: hypothetical protein JJU33_02325 [Phycisphaerales bacterium]|nr:hypothetical protein [Phycisphaerales bacterium]